jgi:hypothetical protein
MFPGKGADVGIVEWGMFERTVDGAPDCRAVSSGLSRPSPVDGYVRCRVGGDPGCGQRLVARCGVDGGLTARRP